MISLLKKLFRCCNNDSNLEIELDLLQPLNELNYNLMTDRELIPKYLNYRYTFNINEKQFVCSNIDVILEKIINKKIQLSFISRIYSEKNFFIIHGNTNYKIFEILCLYGDIIDLNFSFDQDTTIYFSYINSNNQKKIESREIVHDKIQLQICDEVRLIKIYIKYGSIKFYQDILSMCSIWFKNHSVHHIVDYNPDILIDNELNSIFIGFIKPMSNILIYNY